MITISLILFYFVSLIILNSFVLYPLIIHFVFGKIAVKKSKKETMPSVTFMIAAYNEEKVIARRIENIAGLDYDFEKVEVLIGSDLSTDSTNKILSELKEKYNWLKIYFSDNRKGKAGILNELITIASNEILIFTDANTEFQKDTLKKLIRDFSDEKVGGVCGRLILTENESSINESVEESKYWQYETLIKRAEGDLGISFSANGGIFAIRKELFELIPTDKPVTDDLFVSLSVVSKGYKFTYAEDAIAFEETGKDVNAEYNRKVRFSATNFQTLIFFKNILFGKNILLSYAFFSHKVTRWFLPALLILLLIFSFISANASSLAFLLFSLQVFFYFFALIGYLFSIIKIRFQLFSLPYFFVVSNLAVLQGFIKFINKRHSVIWESTGR